MYIYILFYFILFFVVAIKILFFKSFFKNIVNLTLALNFIIASCDKLSFKRIKRGRDYSLKNTNSIKIFKY